MFNLLDALDHIGSDDFTIVIEQLSHNGAWVVLVKRDDGTQYSGTSQADLAAAVEAVYRLVYIDGR